MPELGNDTDTFDENWSTEPLDNDPTLAPVSAYFADDPYTVDWRAAFDAGFRPQWRAVDLRVTWPIGLTGALKFLPGILNAGGAIILQPHVMGGDHVFNSVWLELEGDLAAAGLPPTPGFYTFRPTLFGEISGVPYTVYAGGSIEFRWIQMTEPRIIATIKARIGGRR